MKSLVVLTLAVIAAVLSLSACSREARRENPPPEQSADPATSDTIHVTGTLLIKDDKVPADGGVTLVIQTESGDSITVELESLFTLPQPLPERQMLYQKTVPLYTGDRVHVVATRMEGRLRLEDIGKVE